MKRINPNKVKADIRAAERKMRTAERNLKRELRKLECIAAESKKARPNFKRCETC